VFVTGALAEHAAQPKEDEHRQRKKDYGVDVHVASLSDGCWPRIERRTGILFI
jgi:hypothetical protein